MKIYRLSAIILFMFVTESVLSQENFYPDSIKCIVIKVEPLSIVYNHIGFGFEVPLNGTFVDVTLGTGNVGLNDFNDRTGGFQFKLGWKFPITKNTPYSQLYLMPLYAISSYRMQVFNPVNESKKIKANALMLGLGYRHQSPSSVFYYDGGLEMGLGLSNYYLAENNYNFQIGGSPNSQNAYLRGVAISIHFAIGIQLKKK